MGSASFQVTRIRFFHVALPVHEVAIQVGPCLTLELPNDQVGLLLISVVTLVLGWPAELSALFSRFFGKHAFHRNIQIAACFAISNIWHTSTDINANPKLEFDFANFSNRQILKGSQSIGGVSPNGTFDRLEVLGDLLSRFGREKTTFWVVGIR